MRMTCMAASVAVVTITAGACSLDPQAIVVRADHDAYTIVTAEDGVMVTFVIENAGTATRHFARCGDHVPSWAERQRSSSLWEAVDYSSFMCQANQSMVPLRLGAGESYHDSRRVDAAGQYRICVHFGSNERDMYTDQVCSTGFAVHD